MNETGKRGGFSSTKKYKKEAVAGVLIIIILMYPLEINKISLFKKEKKVYLLLEKGKVPSLVTAHSQKADKKGEGVR